MKPRESGVRTDSTGGCEGWPLVGRASLIAELTRTLRKQHPPTGWMIWGEAGIGKTRLLAEFADRATAAGWAVESVVGAVSTSAVPMGALAQLVPHQPPSSPDPALFLASIREELLARHEGERLLLAIDDAPRLDPVSAGFVAQLAVMGYCRIVCTGRSDERSAGPIEGLIKDRLVEVTPLGPLSDDDIATLVRSTLDGDIEPPTVARLIHLAEGNPLFLREILTTGLESGLLNSESGRWTMETPLMAGPGLRRLVADRLGRLPADQHRGLETLALSEPLELHFAEGVLGQEALVDLERRGVVRVRVDGRRSFVEFEHPLFADVIRAATPTTSRRAATNCLMDAMSAMGARRHEDQLRMAVWHLESGHPLGADVLLQAARIANASFDAALGERIARAAVDAGSGPDGYLLLADAISLQGRVEEARQVIEGIDLEEADDGLRTDILLAWARNEGMRGGDFLGAAGYLLRERDSVTSVERRAEIDGLLSILQALGGQVRAGLGTARQLLATPEAPEPLILGALTITSLASTWLCDFEAVEADVARGLGLATRWRRAAPDSLERLLTNLHNTRTYNGRAMEAETGLRDAYEEACRPPAHPFAPYLGVWLGDVLSIRGDMPAARTVLQRCMEWSGVVSLVGARGLAALLSLVVAGRAGDSRGVTRTLKAVESGPLIAPPSHAWKLRAEAWRQAARSDYRGAAASASRAGRLALGAEYPLVASWCLHEAVIFGHPGDSTSPLREIANSTTSATLHSFASHAESLKAGDPDALEEVAESFEARGELFFAARCHRQAARLYQRSNDHSRAVRATTRAELLRPDNPRLGAWGLETECHGLTPREAEIAALAAAGTSSKEIADRLYLSVRTVDNHLSSAYTKLGVHSRKELASVLHCWEEGG